MQDDDFSIFWRNDVHAQGLFYDLLARTERDAYDDDFLMQLAAYREAGGDAAHADIFAAQYLLANGDAEAAAVCGERAFRLHAVEPAVWAVLRRAYTATARYADALVMQAYTAKLLDHPLTLPTDIPHSALTPEVLDRLSVAMGKPSYAPMALSRMSWESEKGLCAAEGVFAGEFIPTTDVHRPPYYVATYTEQEQQGNKAWLLQTIQSAEGFSFNVGGEFVYDIIRVSRAPGRAEIHCAGENVLPIIGVTPFQRLHIKTQSLAQDTPLNPATPNFFRLTEDASLSSDRDFLVGTPISIGHDPMRHPLVLNILADALPWAILREHFAEWMPNTARFFAQGTIFDQHFSVSEYTYPSLPTIETGMYPHHSQIFNDKFAIPLAVDIITLSERLHDLGYATTNLMGDGIGIYNGATRGHDRLLVAGYRLLAYEGVERTIRHLEGLGDSDQFIFLHTADLHPWPYPLFQITSSVQARLPLTERLSGAEGSTPSPYLRATPLSATACIQGIRDLDRALGTLFAYLEQHYTPDEYLVNIYSDHGVPVFSEHHYIVSPEMTHAAWMMRGAGVPAGITVSEMTSTVDIYPTLAHLLHFPVGEHVDGVLPQIFGGSGREIAFSNSLYPGRTYCLRARTKAHVFHLETTDGVRPNGTVNLAHAEKAFYLRTEEGLAGHEIDDPSLRAFFYPRVRDFLKGIADNGEVFPLPKEA